jgi:hypothetical protein
MGKRYIVVYGPDIAVRGFLRGRYSRSAYSKEKDMPESVSWLPDREALLAVLCGKWDKGLSNQTVVTAFAWKPEDVTVTAAAVSAFLAAWAVYREVNSTANCMAKDEAKKAAKDAMRDFARYNIRFNRLMTPEQKLYYGVRTWHKGHRIEVPGTVPALSPRPGNIRQIIMDYKDVGADRNGKPKGVHGIEIRWAILDHLPSGEEELIHSSFDTRHPFRITFREEDRGKTVYFMARWEIQRAGEKGKFGPVTSAVIP